MSSVDHGGIRQSGGWLIAQVLACVIPQVVAWLSDPGMFLSDREECTLGGVSRAMISRRVTRSGPSQPTLLATAMKLQDLFKHDAISLELESRGKEDVLTELASLVDLVDRDRTTLIKTLKRRENLGSTGIGKGIAIPHCRSLVVSHLHLAYGRSRMGVDFRAIDGAPVHNFFLIVAPPLEVSNQYLPVLGKIAQFAKDPKVPQLLEKIDSTEQFLNLVAEWSG